MKTQLIQLDPYDDVISVRDKMGWSQTKRILLIWPEHAKILTRQLDLLQLKRTSASLGAQLALVTGDPIVLEIAKALDIPTFATTLQAQNTRWRGRRRRSYRILRLHPPPDVVHLRQQHNKIVQTWQDHPIVKYSLLGISLASIFSLVLFFLPKAIITIHPETRVQEISMQVAASPEYQTVNLVGELPVEVISVVVEGRDSIPTTGRMMIPQDQASGLIRLTNLTNHEIRVPAGLVITTLDQNPVRFVTIQSGVVPTGPGRATSLPINAVQPGESGNLPANSLVAIEGELGLSLSATNQTPTHGGSQAPAPAPSIADQDELSDRLTETLRGTALEDLNTLLQNDDFLLQTTLKVSSILEEEFSPSTGLPGNQLDLTLRLEYQVSVVKGSDLLILIEPIMDANMPEHFLVIPGTMVIRHTILSNPDSNGKVDWSLSVSRTIKADISAENLINVIIGQPVTTVANNINNEFPLESLPQVKINPYWWPRIPYISFRIDIITD